MLHESACGLLGTTFEPLSSGDSEPLVQTPGHRHNLMLTDLLTALRTLLTAENMVSQDEGRTLVCQSRYIGALLSLRLSVSAQVMAHALLLLHHQTIIVE